MKKIKPMHNRDIKKALLPFIIICFLFPFTQRAHNKEANDGGKKYRIMEFRNASIESVLDYINDVTSLTIIKHPKLKGKVTIINKEKLTINEIIGILYSSLKELGFTLEIKKNILKIIPLDSSSMKTEIRTDENISNIPDGDQIITQIISLKYIPVATIISNVRPFLSKYGKLSANTKANKLIISDSASVVKRTFKVVKVLDQSDSMAAKEVEIIYIKNMPIDKMEKILNDSYRDLQIIDTQDYPARRKIHPRRKTSRRGKKYSSHDKFPLQLIKQKQVNAFIAIGTKEEVSNLKRFIKKLDITITPTIDLEISIIHLKYLKPDKMMELLNSIFDLDGDNNGAKSRSRSRSRRNRTPEESTTGQGNLPLGGTPKLIEFQENEAVVIIANEKDTAKIKEVIDLFEKEMKKSGYKAGEIATEVYFIQNQKAEEIVNILKSLLTSSKETGDRPLFYADKSTNSIVFTTPAEQRAEIYELLKKLDKKLSQVLIEVLITEVTLNDDFNMGIDWGVLAAVPEKYLGKIRLNGNINVNSFFDTKASTGLTVESTKKNFILNALSTMGNVNILQTPRILTLDNKEAVINIGKKVAFVTEEISITGQNQDNVTTSKKIKYRDVGVKLTVKPHINDKKTVTLEVKQEVNDTSASGDVEHPDIITREINSTIMIDHEKTAVLGGLIRDKEVTDEKKIPLLGDIPLLGALFKHQHKRKEKTQLMLFITPYVVFSNEDFKKINYETLKKLDLLEKKQKETIDHELRVEKEGKASPQSNKKKAGNGKKK